MKSEKAKEAIERYRQAFLTPYQADETAEYCRLFKEIAELAEQEAEERMRQKAEEAFLSCCCCEENRYVRKKCETCESYKSFIQELNE